MKHQHLTWFILADGTHGDPNDVAPDKDGTLRHENGLAVALHADGTPMSVGVTAVEGKNALAAAMVPEPVEPAEATRDMVAEPAPAPAPKKPYKTRGK